MSIHFVKINYVIGDATNPQGNGIKLIPHICNNIGAWGKGFVMALSNKWSEPENIYRSYSEYHLTNVHYVKVEDDIVVVNMIAQDGIGKRPNGKPPISYGALRVCLNEVFSIAKKINATIHMPRIGTGLAGGDWKIIENIIKETITVDVFVYDLK